MTAAEVMEQLRQLHVAFEEKTIEFDDFEEQKSALLDRLAAGFDDDGVGVGAL